MKKFVYCEGMMVTDAKRNLTGSLRYQRHVSKKLMMRAGFS
ncbi:unknown [Clostridium sp. CAG:230]|nr:unknown [Clostridium sp. CAG:230]